MGLEQYKGDMEMCCRCSACKLVPMQRVSWIQVCQRLSQHFQIQLSQLLGRRPTEYRRGDAEERLQLYGQAPRHRLQLPDVRRLRRLLQLRHGHGSHGADHEFRIKCVEDGKTHPALDKVIAGLRKNGSMVPVKGKRGDWATGPEPQGRHQGKGRRAAITSADLTSYDPSLQKVAKATARILAEGRSRFRHRRRCRDQLRRSGLPDGVQGGLSESGQEEHGLHQASRSQDGRNRLRRRVPRLQGSLRQVQSEGRA